MPAGNVGRSVCPWNRSADRNREATRFRGAKTNRVPVSLLSISMTILDRLSRVVRIR
jgi:hypothetical protein